MDAAAIIDACAVKLVFVNRYFHPDHSATAQLLSDLAFHLAREAGRNVCVVTSRQHYDASDEALPAREVIEGVDVRRVWTTRFGRSNLAGRAFDYATFYLAAGWRLWRELRAGDVVVALTDPPLIGIVAAWAARRRGARWINWVQDAFPEVAQALGLRIPGAGLLRRLRDSTLRGAAVNVVLGQLMSAWARERGAPAGRVTVIPNWADELSIRPVAPDANPLRALWGLAGKFVVGYSGNLGRAHDYRTMLEAAQALRDDPEIVFLLIGGGQGHAALAAEASRRDLRSLRFEGYQPRGRLAESLSVPDVHWLSLAPALEGLIVPSKIYGILAAGRPALMIGDAHGEVGRLLARHGCGWTIAVGEGSELASAVRRLRADRALRYSMGFRARLAAESAGSMASGLAAWNEVLATAERP